MAFFRGKFGKNLEQNGTDTIWLKMMSIIILALLAENLVLSKMVGHFMGSVFSYRREIWCCPNLLDMKFLGQIWKNLEQNGTDTIWLKMMSIIILALLAENLVLSKMDLVLVLFLL